DLSKQSRGVKHLRAPGFASEDLRLESLFDDVQQRLHVDGAVQVTLGCGRDYAQQIAGSLIITKPIDGFLFVLILTQSTEKIDLLRLLVSVQPERRNQLEFGRLSFRRF